MHQHVALPIVALAYAAIAFADGGFSPELIAAAAIAIWWLVIVGVVARWWRGQKVSRDAILVSSLLAGLALWAAFSLGWADDSGRAFVEVVRIVAYLGLFALLVVVSTLTGPRPLLAGLAVGMTIVVVAALSTRYIPALGSEDRALYAELPAAAGRLSFPIAYWNGLAACLAPLLVLLAWFGATASSRGLRAVAVGLIPLPVLAIYLASSRGGYAAAAAGLLVLAIFAPRGVRHLLGAGIGILGGAVLALVASATPDLVDGLDTASARGAGAVLALLSVAVCLAAGGLRYLAEPRLEALRIPQVSARTIAGIAVVLVAVGLVAIDPAERLEEFVDAPTDVASSQGAGELSRAGSSGRYQFWGTALDAFADDPITGIGAGNYELYWNQHASIPLVVNNAHSLYLETLAELGVVGAILLFALIGALLVAARKVLPTSDPGSAAPVAAALVVTGLVSAGLDWTWEIPAAFIPVLLGAAVLTQARAEPRAAGGLAVATGPPPGPGPRRRDLFGLGVATLAVAWVSIWAAGVLVVSEVKLDDSHDAAGSGDLESAAQDAVDAGSVQPWSPEPPLWLAQVELMRGDVEAAREAATEAVSRAPEDYRTWLVRAAVERQAGEGGAADAAFARATELAPLPLPGQEEAPPG